MYDPAEAPSGAFSSAPTALAAPRRRYAIYRGFGKRAFDVVFVVSILPVLVPLVCVLALVVRRDGGPAFFMHERAGRHGRPFKCLKLRTMVVDSEAALEAHLEAHPDQRLLWERDYKLPDDPRITRVGRLLRKLSLDELPQFFNVLAGQMSIVGPRPVTMPELEFYGNRRATLLSVRPGITGPWQVGGRNAVGYIDRVELDLAYAREHRFLGDVKLILATIIVAVRGTGL